MSLLLEFREALYGDNDNFQMHQKATAMHNSVVYGPIDVGGFPFLYLLQWSYPPIKEVGVANHGSQRNGRGTMSVTVVTAHLSRSKAWYDVGSLFSP